LFFDEAEQLSPSFSTVQGDRLLLGGRRDLSLLQPLLAAVAAALDLS
jgi:hypothetical protein